MENLKNEQAKIEWKLKLLKIAMREATGWMRSFYRQRQLALKRKLRKMQKEAVE